MRPCQQCGSPLELNAATCPKCNTLQVESVGVKAPDPGPQRETKVETNLVNDPRLFIYPLLACYLVAGACAWWASGSFALGVGTLVAMLAIPRFFS